MVSIFVSDPKFENRLEIVGHGCYREDLALGQVAVDRCDNYLCEHALSGRKTSSHASDSKDLDPNLGVEDNRFALS
jgi:hypothetical protein